MSLVNEMKKMNMIFYNHRVMAKVQPVDPRTKKQTLIIAPSYYIIPVQRHATTKISQVMSLLPELRSAITQERRKATAVRFSDDLCSAIEIARPDPKALDLNLDTVNRLGKFQAAVGKSYQYGAKEELLSLALSTQGSTFASGMQGTGKSTFMRSFLGTMAVSTSPTDLHIHLVDMKHRSLVPFESLPHVVGVAYDEANASRVVRAVYAEMMARQREAKPHRTLLVVDELRELKFADPDLLEMVSRIASLGRELGVQLLCATQKPLASELGSILKSQFAVRVVGTLEDANASQHVTGRSGANAHLLEGNGSMLMCATGREPTRIQVYNASDDVVSQLVNRASQKWGYVQRPEPIVVQTPVEQPAITIQMAGGNRTHSDAQLIAEEFDRMYDPANGLAVGAKSKFARLILGQDGKYAGGATTRIDRAIQHLVRERSAVQ